MQQPLYQQRAYPVFQNRMYGSADDARNCPKGDILLTQDPATGIVSNRAFQPELVVYDEYYQNEQGVSPAFQKHLERVADIVETRLGKDRLVEVGCGTG